MATPPRIVINIPNSAGQRDSAAARRTVARWLIAMVVLAVIFCGLFPFDFSIGFASTISEIREKFDLTTGELFTTRESWEKLVFYLPLGFALGSALWAWRGLKTTQIVLRCVMALACATAIASFVELSQVFVSRDPALADILAKITGSAIGFGLFIVCGEAALQLLAQPLIKIQRMNNPRIFGTAAGVWLAIAVIAPISVRNIGSLSSWEPAYPALIGNETDGVRHWDGTVSNVWLTASAISDDDLESVLAAKDPAALLKKSQVMAFHLEGVGPYTDASGHTGEFTWTPNYNTGAVRGTTQPSDLTGVAAIGRAGVPLSEGWFLRTANGGASHASDSISRSDAFTLVIDLAVHDLDHGFGWPRIFSISKNSEECNLQLLQDHENLQLRIRNAASGDGGSDPEFYVPNIFTNTSPQRLIVSYDHGRTRVACSESGERYSLKYLPDAWLVWRIFPGTYWHYTMGSSGQFVASGIYRMLAMLPIGIFMGAIIRILRRRAKAQHVQRILIVGVCGATLLLEASLHFAAGTPISVISPVISLIAACAGSWIVVGTLPTRRKWI